MTGGGTEGVGRELVPRWFRRAVVLCGGLLVIGAVVWVLGWIALKLALVTLSVATALLLAALLSPLARLLHRALPAWLAAGLSVVFLVAVVGGTGYLLEQRIRGQLENLASSLTASINGIRDWLVTGPLSLRPEQVDQVRSQIVDAVRAAAPSGVAAANTVISVLSGLLIALFVLFFFLKDGAGMWRSVVAVGPARHRERLEEAGRRGWETLSRYVRGVVVIAVADAVLIGIGLFVLGVPLALTLSLLVFLGAFVPLIGATVSGAAAVLVALVTRGPVIALLVLGIVLVVQNVEGNLLQPFVQSRAVKLHPVVILLSVTAGYLLFGVAGAVIAVPLVAVARSVTEALHSHGAAPQETPAPEVEPDRAEASAALRDPP
ncbi:AI-2E family transporter [Actinomycetospora cinnamomea]|uniref:Putative PurR-regulated permease PerM n=1 Tax=Actinomycetospora cinnamomea TaxID=663609 RepID=A0A2U1F3X5_9PSEU|nr:AI-2E family transporter [Actinomycetospora cinnamomea]PVZ06849.1 putative PurR-regulated permease PerM [Actinomycetospora cinnamomea]